MTDCNHHWQDAIHFDGTYCKHCGIRIQDSDTIERLSTESRDLNMHLRRVLDAVDNDTGAEPSVSALGRTCDEAEEYLISRLVSGRQK